MSRATRNAITCIPVAVAITAFPFIAQVQFPNGLCDTNNYCGIGTMQHAFLLAVLVGIFAAGALRGLLPKAAK